MNWDPVMAMGFIVAIMFILFYIAFGIFVGFVLIRDAIRNKRRKVFRRR
jgi:hypothetical protein